MYKALINIRTVFLILSVLFFTSCKKQDSSQVGTIVPGWISLEVHCVHHNWDVSNIMIYLKRNALDFPGKDSSIYDFKGQADGYGKYTFENLYPGNYYVYASGFDPVWGANVIGYMPVVLDKAHAVNDMAFLTLYVSE